MKKPKPTFHPSCPKKLISALRRAKWNQSQCAHNLKVNKGALNKLLVLGIEPQAEELRIGLFLSKRPHKRYAGCNACKQQIEIQKNGKISLHATTDGTPCQSSNTRDFLANFKPHKPPSTSIIHNLPSHRKWWNKQPPEFKDTTIYNAWLIANG